MSEHLTDVDQLPSKDLLSPLKISKRVKHGCVYRYSSGPRRGRMCGEEVARIKASDYCAEHGIKILSRSAKC